MTDPGRDTSARPNSRDRARRRRGRKQPRTNWEIMLGVLVLLAIVASVIMVFTDSVPLLRIGLVAALWAAVVGAIAMTKFRKDSENDAARARDLKLVYELQLDREISARREYELVVETQVRQQVEERMRSESSAELEALRTEVVSLRASLEALFDGELPDERLAVRAESHRLQELGGGPVDRVAEQAAELPELDDVVAVTPDATVGEGFEPDYEAFREAAQFLPGMGGEDAAVVGADDDAVFAAAADADEADADEADVEADVDEAAAHDAAVPGDEDAHEADEADEADTDAVVVEGPHEAGDGGAAGVDGEADADEAEYADVADVAEDPADVEYAGDAEDPADVDDAGYGADADLAEEAEEAEGSEDTEDSEGAEDSEDSEDSEVSEHSERPGGNTVAELLERMAESGSLPENLGRRRRRARD